MTGPAKTAPTPATAASAALNGVSQSLPPNSHMQEAAGTGNQPRKSTEVDRETEEDSMKQADQDFQNGLDALNR